MSRPRVLPLVLALAILGISVSGPLARLAGAPPLAIATWRLLLSLGLVGIALLATGSWREWRTLHARDLAIALGAGGFLALHFWSWIASLGLTSVAASVLLVNLHPLVIVLGSALWLGERPTRGQLLGLGVALIGAVVVGVGSAGSGPASLTAAAASRAAAPGALATAPANSAIPLLSGLSNAALGNLLAVVGAVTVGVYYLAGRSLRQRLSLWPYVGLVYGACFVVLLGLAVVTRTPLWPYGRQELGIFALIAVGPMLAGHTGFNWALRYVPAYVVSLALLAEPLGAALIAALLPAIAEFPSPTTIVGGLVVLGGLALAARAPR